MLSFYGGRRGSGFDIVTSFTSKSEMDAQFNNIPYGKYVTLITSEGNSVWKRGLNDFIRVADILEIDTSRANDRPDVILDKYSTIMSQSEKQSGVFTSADVVFGSENDPLDRFPDVGYASYIEQDAQNEDARQSHIGFQIPIPKIDFVSNVQGAVTRIDNERRPLYQKWQINVPESYGTAFKNFRAILSSTVTEQNPIYQWGNNSQPIDPTTLPSGYILVYDYEDTRISQEVKTYYFGPYNTITDITFTNGFLSISTASSIPNKTNPIISPQIKGLNSIEITTDGIVVTYNTTHTEDGQDVPDTDLIPFNFPKQMSYDSTTSKVSVTYNSGTSDDLYTANYIEDLFLDSFDKKLYVKYSDPTYEPERYSHSELYPEYIDYGALINTEGILVGLNVTPQQIIDWYASLTPTPIIITGDPTEDQILTYLDTVYPLGTDVSPVHFTYRYIMDEPAPENSYLTEDTLKQIMLVTNEINSDDVMGRMITYGETYGKKDFYTYDYSTYGQELPTGNHHWYYVGGFRDRNDETEYENQLQASVIAAVDPTDPDQEEEITNKLVKGGIWFRTTSNLPIQPEVENSEEEEIPNGSLVEETGQGEEE